MAKYFRKHESATICAAVVVQPGDVMLWKWPGTYCWNIWLSSSFLDSSCQVIFNPSITVLLLGISLIIVFTFQQFQQNPEVKSDTKCKALTHFPPPLDGNDVQIPNRCPLSFQLWCCNVVIDEGCLINSCFNCFIFIIRLTYLVLF